MNKTELIDTIAKTTDLSKTIAADVCGAILDIIKEALKRGEEVRIPGFGIFLVRKRAARTGRNPKTGETIAIKASKLPAFKAGKDLKEAVR